MIDAIGRDDLDTVVKYTSQRKNPYHNSYRHGCILDESINRPRIFEYLITIYDIDQIDNDGMTLLMRMVFYDNIHGVIEENISLILKHTKNINMVDVHGNTALMLLEKNLYSSQCYEKMLDIVKLLMDNGANPNIENTIEYSAIDYILTYCYRDYVFEHIQILLSSKYENVIKMKTLVRTVSKVSSNYYDVIEFLLPYVKDINELCEGCNILWYTQMGNSDSKNDIIELLIANGARDNVPHL